MASVILVRESSSNSVTQYMRGYLMLAKGNGIHVLFLSEQIVLRWEAEDACCWRPICDRVDDKMRLAGRLLGTMRT